MAGWKRAARGVTVAGLIVAMVAAPAAGGVAWAGAASDGPRALLQTGANELHGLGITGVQAVERDDGRTVAARAGVADLTTGAPVPENGYFRMGSNTKTFVSITLLQLVGEGRLSLDDRVERWLPGVVAGNGNDGRTITVRQLLQHTSGLFNYTNDLPALASPEAFQAHRFDHYNLADLAAIAMKHEPEFAPGTSWSYSNTNYILAGMIVERITGHSWQREVSDRILRPLRLGQTLAPADYPHVPAPHATAYQQWEPDGTLMDTTEWNPTVAGSAGAMITTPADLARFWQAVQSGRLLKPAQQAELHKTVLAVTFQDAVPGGRYGLGIMWIPLSCGGGYWGHGGDVPGTSTVNGVTDSGRRAVVVSLTTQLVGDEDSAAVFARSNRLVDDALCRA